MAERLTWMERFYFTHLSEQLNRNSQILEHKRVLLLLFP